MYQIILRVSHPSGTRTPVTTITGAIIADQTHANGIVEQLNSALREALLSDRVQATIETRKPSDNVELCKVMLTLINRE